MELGRNCPVCNTGFELAKTYIKKNIDPLKFSDFTYSSRKLPEFMSHQMFLCPNCGLVYASQPPDKNQLAKSYNSADYDSANEADDAALAYINAIRPTLTKLNNCQKVLEIGAGTGVFLDYLSNEGFVELVGIEPSLAAIEASPLRRRNWILHGMFEEFDFEPESFDLICCFMTMEHVGDPKTIANTAFRLLRPGGAFVTVTHDYRAFVNRILGKRSAIIDIEHLQLFSKQSLHYLFRSTGYSEIDIKPFVNTYTIQYWFRLAPFPINIKKHLLKTIESIRLNDKKVSIKVGNLITTGFK